MTQRCSQEKIDQIYGRLTAGPIPDGAYLGDLFFAARRGWAGAVRLERGAGRASRPAASPTAKIEKLAERVGRVLWKGKVFYRDQRVLRNLHRRLPDRCEDVDRRSRTH